MTINTTWTSFKDYLTRTGVSFTYLDHGEEYHYDIWTVDGKEIATRVSHEPSGEETADQTDFETNYLSKAKSFITSYGTQKISLYESEGSFSTLVSHDWTDKTTWYQKSTRVTGETLAGTGLDYTTANESVIDTSNGKIFNQKSTDFDQYRLKVYDNGVLKTEVTDYTVVYSTGTITFLSTPTGPVTADYSYAGSSEFCWGPAAGKMMHVQHAEVQFTEDVVVAPFTWSVYAYNPLDLPNKIAVDVRYYANAKDIISICNLGQGFIQAFDVLTKDILVFPVNYARSIDMRSSQGIEMRVKLDDDIPLSG